MENKIISIKEELISSESNNDLFLMSLENNSYYGLNDVSKRIFEIIKDTISFNDLIKILLNEYDIDEEICKNEVKFFLNKLKKENIININ